MGLTPYIKLISSLVVSLHSLPKGGILKFPGINTPLTISPTRLTSAVVDDILPTSPIKRLAKVTFLPIKLSA